MKKIKLMNGMKNKDFVKKFFFLRTKATTTTTTTKRTNTIIQGNQLVELICKKMIESFL